MTAFCNHFIRVDLCDVCSPIKDPRDAEIASLKAEVERFKRALAAGPAALRALPSDDYSPRYVAGKVERAQAAAMKEDGDGKE